MLNGRATPTATQTYATQHPHLTYHCLNNGVWISQAGFGSYRVETGIPAHEQALRHALLNGINLIDTSSNYGDGRSEELIGQVLSDLVQTGQVPREAVVIISKAGYLQGQNLQIAQAFKKAGRPFPNVVEYDDHLKHCIHPDFLADQLDRTLQRLNIQTLDLFLLHNPEYYLKWAHRVGIVLAEARRTYYERIALAFQHLEKEVTNGRIQAYGISSNTFPGSSWDTDFTSLERVWHIAEQIGEKHAFQAIQLPMNLLEPLAMTHRNQFSGESVVQYARQRGLAVLVNRPLNAVRGETFFTRLADIITKPAYPATAAEVSTAVDTLVEMEVNFQHRLLPQFQLDGQIERRLLELLAVGRMLQGHWRGFGTYFNWQGLQEQYIVPRAQGGIQFLSRRENLPAEAVSWLDRYVDKVNEVLAAVSAFYQEETIQQGKRIRQAAAQADPDWQIDTLSQTAVRALRSTAGITSVLVGMRQERYVQDVLQELARPVAVKNRDEAWQKLLQFSEQ